MIRLIFKQEQLHGVNQLRTLNYFTVDVNLPEIEAILLSGGMGESGYSHTQLIGAELIIGKETAK